MRGSLNEAITSGVHPSSIVYDHQLKVRERLFKDAADGGGDVLLVV